MAAKEKKKLTNEEYKTLELVTKRFILSYPKVFKKGEYQGKETNFNFTMMFKKQSDDLKTDPGMEGIRKALHRAKVLFWGADSKKWPKGYAQAISDGDAGDAKNPGFWIVKATSQNKIPVYDTNHDPITEESDVYGGAVCRAHIQAAVYNLGVDKRTGMENAGVKFYAQGLQKMAEGERLGGGANSRKAFADNTDDEMQESEDEGNYGDDAGGEDGFEDSPGF